MIIPGVVILLPWLQKDKMMDRPLKSLKRCSQSLDWLMPKFQKVNHGRAGQAARGSVQSSLIFSGLSLSLTLGAKKKND